VRKNTPGGLTEEYTAGVKFVALLGKLFTFDFEALKRSGEKCT
jgi:hypothetical protein